MDYKLEVMPVPVTDVDRARDFYRDKLGFNVDLDQQISNDFRIVQLTPAGSGCSIHLVTTKGLPAGSLKGQILVVDDIEAAHAELAERGAETSEVVHFEGGEQVPGKGGRWNSFVFFKDPDGNEWALQERPSAGG
jgi:catechol 2,3-dioxygenase-like lactoylglutathione lyase family enzyme